MTSKRAESLTSHDTVITAADAESLLKWQSTPHSFYNHLPIHLQKFTPLLTSVNSSWYLTYIEEHFSSSREDGPVDLTIGQVITESPTSEDIVITAKDAQHLLKWRNGEHSHYDTLPKELEKFAILLTSLNSPCYLSYIEEYFSSSTEQELVPITVGEVIAEVGKRLPAMLEREFTFDKVKTSTPSYAAEIKKTHQKYIDDKHFWIWPRQHEPLAKKVTEHIPDDLRQQAILLGYELLILTSKNKDVLLPAVQDVYKKIHHALSSVASGQKRLPALDRLQTMSLTEFDGTFADESSEFRAIFGM